MGGDAFSKETGISPVANDDENGEHSSDVDNHPALATQLAPSRPRSPGCSSYTIEHDIKAEHAHEPRRSGSPVPKRTSLPQRRSQTSPCLTSSASLAPLVRPITHKPSSESIFTIIEPNGKTTVINIEREKQYVDVAARARNAHATESGAEMRRRKGVGQWRWRSTVAVLSALALIQGYDVSSIAAVQAPIHASFHQMHLLPWIALASPAAHFAVAPVARKVLDTKSRFVSPAAMAVFCAGAAVAGSAGSLPAFIVGRVVAGIATAFFSHCPLGLITSLACPHEIPTLTSILTACNSVGLLVGMPIAAALASNLSATWRWALYMPIPPTAVLAILSFFILPSSPGSTPNITPIPLTTRLSRHDPLGVILHAAAALLFAAALTLPQRPNGPTAIVLLVLLAAVVIAYLLQQGLCVLTTRESRVLHIDLLFHPRLAPLYVATAAASCAFTLALFYTPLFVAFTQSSVASSTHKIQARWCTLPFIGVFAVSCLLANLVLPVIKRHKAFYVVAGAVMMASGAALATHLATTTAIEARLPFLGGTLALLGFGIGLVSRHSSAVANVLVMPTHKERLESMAIFAMAQTGSMAGCLAIMGLVFQTVGVKLLRAAADVGGDEHLRECLAGVLAGDDLCKAQMGVAVGAIVATISKMFWAFLVAGVVVFVSGLAMKWEKADFSRPSKV